jgi:hypothetical protein
MNIMKYEIPFLPALLFLGTDMLARVAVQGVEQGLLSTVIEFSMNRWDAVRGNFSSSSEICLSSSRKE